MKHSTYAVERLLRVRATQPFAWGRRDCAMFVFDALLMLTGRDPARDLRGTWADALGAMRTLRAEGGWEGLARRFGAEISPADAEPGDVLLLQPGVCDDEMAAHGALALRWGEGAIAQGGDGLVTVPLSSAVRAWRAC